jgi:GNAT superfamily N-acetyltransferase
LFIIQIYAIITIFKRNMESDIQYARETVLDPDEFIQLLNESTLGERRPVDNRERIVTMCNNANLIFAARHKGKLVGVARSLTDFAFCTYLSDLAVSELYQKKGIGKELVRRVREAVPDAVLILLAAPKAVNYYPKIGMIRHEAAYFLKAADHR